MRRQTILVKPREGSSRNHKYSDWGSGEQSKCTSGSICSLIIFWIVGFFYSPYPLMTSLTLLLPFCLLVNILSLPNLFLLLPPFPSFQSFLQNPTATDLLFARTNEGHPVPFATAGDCYSAAKCPQVRTRDANPPRPGIHSPPWPPHPTLGCICFCKCDQNGSSSSARQFGHLYPGLTDAPSLSAPRGAS